jgi:hypothetical protein
VSSAAFNTPARALPAREVASIPGVEVSEASAADYLEAVNGRAKLDVPAVRGEHKVPMRGTVPTEWSLE